MRINNKKSDKIIKYDIIFKILINFMKGFFKKKYYFPGINFSKHTKRTDH